MSKVDCDNIVHACRKLRERMDNKFMEQQKIIDDLNHRLQKFERIYKAIVDEESKSQLDKITKQNESTNGCTSIWGSTNSKPYGLNQQDSVYHPYGF